MPRALFALLLASALPGVTSAQSAQITLTTQAHLAQRGRVLDVLSIYRDLNDMCRSGDEDPHALKACNVREKVARLLNGMGWCYGIHNQKAVDLQWHKCTRQELF